MWRIRQISLVWRRRRLQRNGNKSTRAKSFRSLWVLQHEVKLENSSLCHGLSSKLKWRHRFNALKLCILKIICIEISNLKTFWLEGRTRHWQFIWLTLGFLSCIEIPLHESLLRKNQTQILQEHWDMHQLKVTRCQEGMNLSRWGLWGFTCTKENCLGKG